MSTSANRRTRTAIQAGVEGGGSPGLALLLACDAWWDFRAGSLANRGTIGSAVDAVLGASTAAPTFNSDHYTFDGVDDYIRVPHHTSIDITAPNVDFTVGLILAQTTVNSYGPIIQKGTITVGSARWRIYNQMTNRQVGFEPLAASGTGANRVGASSWASGAKVLVGAAVVTGTNTNTFLGSTYGTAGSDTRSGGTYTNTRDLYMGAGEISGALGYWQKLDLFGAFIKRGALTSAQLADIAAEYGV